MNSSLARIGIYAGTFDPVHAGHITFAVQAMTIAGLDRLYFMPERQPRRKYAVEHFAHRVGMLNRAIRPYKKFGVIELVDVNFTVAKTLPYLEQRFKNSQLVFLQGSDDVLRLPTWPQYEQLIRHSELVIGVRQTNQTVTIRRAIASWPVQPKACHIFDSFAPDISSSAVRQGLRQRQIPRGLLTSVARYSNRHWLYVSLS